jgi:CBS domain-containing protein
MYNIAQVAAAPVLAAGANSPMLFGKRLWRETRIALFEQAVDTRSSNEHLRERQARVSFGRDWVRDSVLDLFREDVARFRTVLGIQDWEDPIRALDEGRIPSLKALRLHNGTVYRWNRACYGILDDKPHLRIENRVLPSGPTPVDELANAAFWFGLIASLAKEVGDVTRHMAFDEAKDNFQAAARHGLESTLTWFNGRHVGARELILEELLPMARDGLAMGGIYSSDIDRYLGALRERVETGHTGARWQLASYKGLKGTTAPGERLNALVAATRSRQQRNEPVARWEPARGEESGDFRTNFVRVDQYMTTDLFTVHEDEALDLVANLMEWEKIRHVPVEDSRSRLVGLISYRSLLRLLARGMSRDGKAMAVREVMRRDPITITPDTNTLDAVQLMRKHRVGCLPVVKDGTLVGIVTERDFMNVAAGLLEEKLGG